MEGIIRLSWLAFLLALLLAILGCSNPSPDEPRSPAENREMTEPGSSGEPAPVDARAVPPVPSPTPQEEVRGGGIEGRVLGPSGAPVAGCEIVLLKMGSGAYAEFVRRGRYRQSEPFATTGGDGRFLVNEIPPGTYMLAFRAPGLAYHEDFTHPVEVRAGETVRRIEQRLQPGGTITGQVVENLTGEPIAEARVKARPVSVSSGSQAREGLATVSDVTGEFRLDILEPSEKYDLTATHDRYVTTNLESVMTDTGEPVRMVMSPGGRVEGRVTSSVDGSPIPDATVRVLAGKEIVREVRSASDGEYLMHGLEPGPYRFEAEKGGASTERLPRYELEVTLLGHHRVNLTLTPPGVVELVIVDTETQEPIEGAEVEFKGREDRYYSNEEGIVRSGGFRKGQVECKVTHREYLLVNESRWSGWNDWGSSVRPGWFGETIPIHPGEISSCTVEMRRVPLTDLTGIVVDEKDSPVALVEVRAGGHVEEFVSYSESDGAFEFNGIPEGGYGMTLSKEGFAPIGVRVHIDDEKPERFRFVLRKGGSIEGTVVDPEGEPLGGFTIRLDPDRVAEGPVVSDAEGHWRIDHVPEGNYGISASNGGRGSEETGKIHVGWNDHIQGIRLVVAERFSVSGAVVDWRDRRGIPNVRIELAGSSTRTDEAGRFVLKDILSGSHYLQVKDIPQPYVPTYGLRSEKRVSVIDRDVTGLVLEVRKGGTVTGRVLLPSGEPAAGAGVALADPGSRDKRKPTKSDTEGKFEFVAVQPSDTYHLLANLGKYAPARSERFSLEEGGIVEGITIRLPLPGKVSGTIRDASGNPPSGECTLRAESIDLRDTRRVLGDAKPDQSGRYGIGHLPPGQIKLTLSVKDGIVFVDGKAYDDWTKVQERIVEITPGREVTGVDFVVPVKDEKEPEANASIAGRVVDSQGHGIPGIEVRATAMDFLSKPGEGRVGSTTTDPDGSFRIENLSEWDFWLTANAQDPDYANAHLRNIHNPSENVEIVLGKFASIEGRVVLQSTGEAVTEFFLACDREHSMRPPKQFIRDPEGLFRIEKLKPESYRVRVEAEGLGAGERVIAVDYDQHVEDLVFRLGHRSIEGQVVRKRNRTPVSGARVIPASLNPSQHTLGMRVFGTQGQSMTGPDGRFSVTVDAPGSETLIVEHPEFGLAWFPEIEIPEHSGGTRVTLEVEEPGSIVGHAYHESGKPFQDGVVSTNLLTGRYGSEFKTRTDREGYYEFPCLQPGVYSIHWERQFVNYWTAPWTWRVEVRPGETTVLDLGLGHTTVTGTLTRGGELAQLHISFVSETCSRTTYAGNGGQYWIRALTPGTYAVTVLDSRENEILLTDEVTVPPEGEIQLNYDCPKAP